MLKRKGYPEDIEKYIEKQTLSQIMPDLFSTNINTEWTLRGNKGNRQVRLSTPLSIPIIHVHLIVQCCGS